MCLSDHLEERVQENSGKYSLSKIHSSNMKVTNKEKFRDMIDGKIPVGEKFHQNLQSSQPVHDPWESKEVLLEKLNGLLNWAYRKLDPTSIPKQKD